MLIQDNTFSAKKFSPLVYDEKVVNHYKNLKPGSIAFDDFWDEVDYYCLNGYKPKGNRYHQITGEHFSYLNLARIEMLPQGEQRKRAGSPYYRELDHRLFTETYNAKKYRYGLIIGKPRRVGLSWFGSWQMVYELIFVKGNRVGICAGKQDKADSFYAKVLYLLQNIIPEYRVSMYSKNEKKLVLGYDDIINKQVVPSGLMSEMLIRTMFADSAGFEGESLSVAIFEEAGLFQNLIQSYKSTEPCFKEGAIQFGTPLIYGTGGEIEKGSYGYMEMWNNSYDDPTKSAYNLKKIFIPADEYYPGDGEIDEKTGVRAPSFFDIETGKTDRARARAHILAGRQVAKQSKDSFVKHIQSYPLEEREIFIKTSGGVLDRIKLSAQNELIDEGIFPEDIEIQVGRLEWVDDPITAMLVSKTKDTKEACKVRIERESKVKFVEDPNGSFRKIANPINNDNMQHKPDIAGTDSYDDETDNPKASVGATVMYRTYAGQGREYDYPIALLAERGDASADDVFYENSVKMCVYYNAENLIEYSKLAIVNYFKDVGAYKYLKERPDLTHELGPSTSRNSHGQRMTKDVKNLVTKLLKREVRDNCHKIWFKDIIDDFMDYGDKNTDIAMAYGLVLIHKMDIFEEILDEDFDDLLGVSGNDLFDSMTYYDVDMDGNLKIKTYGGDDVDAAELFIPEQHMNEMELLEWKMKKKERQKEHEKRKEDFQKSKEKSFMDLIQSEIERKINSY